MRGPIAACLVALGSCGGPARPSVTVPAPVVTAPDPTPAPDPAPPAPPPAPDPVEAKVRAMAQIKRAWSPSFSPDGARLAYVSDAGGLPEVYVVPVAGGTPERVTKLSDPVGGVRWSPDGAWLAISVAPGGGMNQQIYLVRPDGKDLQRITDGGRDANWLGDWTPDGKALALASSRRDPAAMDAYLFDVDGKKLGLVAKNPGTGSLADVTADRKRGLLLRTKYRGNNDLYLVDLVRGTELLLTPHEGPARFWGEFSPDGKAVYVGSNKDRDRLAFGKIVLGDGKQAGPIQLVAQRDDAELAAFDLGDHGVAALIWNVGGKSELQLVDLATGKPLPAPALPRELMFGVKFSKDGKRLVAELSGPAAPRDLWLLEANAWRQITRSPHEGVALDELVRPELVRFPAHDGLELSGWLYRPRGAAAPARSSSASTAGPRTRSCRPCAATTRRCSRRASRSSRPTSAARRGSARSSSTPTTARAAPTRSGTSRRAPTTSPLRSSRIRSGSASWAARTAAT